MLRFGRYAVTAVIALTLVASTNSSVALSSTEVDAAQPLVERRPPPLPADAVKPFKESGRWFSVAHRRVDAAGVGPNAAQSRQTLIKITGHGARQRFRFDVSLPPGSHLAPNGDGLIAVDEDDSVIGALEAPWAVDATGIKVATRFEVVDRDTFVQVVEHRPVGATYPVFADPWWVIPVIIRVGAHVIGRYVVRRSTLEAAKRWAVKLAAKQAQVNIDKLLARTPIALKELTQGNFRENVRRRTGWAKPSTEGYDAHHTLPQKFNADFSDAGLNIHNPVFGHWWCRTAHQRAAAAFNRKWNDWLEPRRGEIRNTAEWRSLIEKKRIDMVSTPAWARTYQCP